MSSGSMLKSATWPCHIGLWVPSFAGRQNTGSCFPRLHSARGPCRGNEEGSEESVPGPHQANVHLKVQWGDGWPPAVESDTREYKAKPVPRLCSWEKKEKKKKILVEVANKWETWSSSLQPGDFSPFTKAREICKITRRKSILQGPRFKMSLCRKEIWVYSVPVAILDLMRCSFYPNRRFQTYWDEKSTKWIWKGPENS